MCELCVILTVHVYSDAIAFMCIIYIRTLQVGSKKSKYCCLAVGLYVCLSCGTSVCILYSGCYINVYWYFSDVRIILLLILLSILPIRCM